MYFKKKLNFIFILIIQWLICVLFNFYYYGSKFNHFRGTYEEFRSKQTKLEESAVKARDYFLFHTDHVLFNRSVNFLCVAVLSKNRIESPINYVNQAVMSLLTRVNVKQEENLSITLYNVEDNPNNNKHALELSKLIHVESLSSKVNYPNVRVKEAADYALVSKFFLELLSENIIFYTLLICKASTQFIFNNLHSLMSSFICHKN